MEPIELEKIDVGKQATETIEYVPKDEVKLLRIIFNLKKIVNV